MDHTFRVAVAAVVLLGLVVAAVARTTAGRVTEMAWLSPQLGDIVAFDPGPSLFPDLATVVDARLVQGGRCALDTEVLAAHGGSLVVVAKPADGLLIRAHWTGGPTAPGAADCGRDSELLLRPGAVRRLALAAGGFGVADKTPAFVASLCVMNEEP